MEKGIFDGLKVLDCASFIAAPAAATVLSDFGADVIKIEPPGAGDPYRNLPNLPGYPHSEYNFAWMLEARNKRSLALDLSKPEGQAVLHKLAGEADVFITNYPPAVRERLGITHDHLAPTNDRLIYASFTGYGEKGEEANKPGFDSNAYWARSGLMDLVRADEKTTPARSIAGMGDHPCAMAFYGAIVTALYKQRRLGGLGAGASKTRRRQVRRAASARTRTERGHQSLPVQGRPLADPVAAQRGTAMAGAGALPGPRGICHRSPFRHEKGPPRAVAGTDQDL
jgi:crotonobetainyl-CoA:carnitine CoA-transferase CaiB-like acyl-CoA transferase